MKRLAIIGMLLICATCLQNVAAQERTSGIISQEASVDFDPSQILMIVEYPKGMIRFLQGTFSPQPLSASPVSTERTYLVAAKLALATDQKSGETFDFAFLLINDRATRIKVTPVERWHISKLKQNTPTLEQIKKDIGKLETKLSSESADKSPEAAKVIELRNKLADAAELPKIVALRLEIQQKRAELEQKENDIRALRDLVQTTRGREIGDSFGQLRQELADDLRNIASTTARTERLQRRKENTAETSLQAKLKMIRDTEGHDIQSLAEHVLALRRERRALEVKLGVASQTPKPNDEF